MIKELFPVSKNYTTQMRESKGPDSFFRWTDLVYLLAGNVVGTLTQNYHHFPRRNRSSLPLIAIWTVRHDLYSSQL